MSSVISIKLPADNVEKAKAAMLELLDVDKDGKVSYPEFFLVLKFKK